MKGRWVALGVVVGIALALSVGFAFGGGRSGTEPSPSGAANSWAAMDAMHDSPWMEQMRQQMGPEWAAQCDAMHEQMAQWMQENGYGQMGQSGMMGGGSGSGMMGGSGSGMMGGSGSGMMGQ